MFSNQLFSAETAMYRKSNSTIFLFAHEKKILSTEMKEIVPYCPDCPNVPKLKIMLEIGLRIPLCITLCPVLRSLCSAACYIVLLYVMDDAAASAAPYIT